MTRLPCPNKGLLTLFAFLLLAPATHPAEISPAVERMRKDLFFLASDECEGRGPETAGINKAADYIAHTFKEIGLKPALADGSYFQKFNIPGTPTLGSPNSLVVTGPLGQTVELSAPRAFNISGLSGKGKAETGVVFVGYGITTRAGKGEKPVYDDYAGIDVKGKIVIVMRKTPRPSNRLAPFAREADSYAPLVVKIENAEEHKAAAILFVNDRDTASKTDDLMPFDYALGGGRGIVPIFHVHRTLVDQMLRTSTGKSIAEVEGDIDRDLKPQSAELTGWKIKMEATVDRPEVKVKNIVGVLEGKGTLANETVVIGAHYDHLGFGDNGSLGGPGAKGLIHYGADDNGSGTTAVMELARRFASMKDREGRRLVFMLFTAEERGLIGSAHYCKEPIFPLKDTVAMINLDMVGRVHPDAKSHKDGLEIGGLGTAKTFEPQIDKLNRKYEFDLKKTRSGVGPSDHTSFYNKQVPVLFYFSGMHPQYHRPTDKPNLINYEGMNKVVAMIEELTQEIATAKERPEFQKTSGGMSIGRGNIPRLGFMPGEYNEDETRGVPVGGVSPGGPAEKAGIKDGDWIVEVAGTQVRNMSGYMRAMGGQKAGDTIEVVVERSGKKIKLKVTPQ